MIGGSPCTYWSICQKKDRETESSGLGWELFKNYAIAKEKWKPDLFLYENNYSIDRRIKEAITRELGVSNMMVDASLVSAQTRKREYWFNWDAPQPEDKQIYLVDILDSGIVDKEKSYCLKHQAGNARDYIKKHHTQVEFEPVAIGYRGRDNNGKWVKQYEANHSGKANALTTARTDSMVAEPVRVGTIENAAKNQDHDSKQYLVYSPFGKATTICGQGGGVGAKTGLYAVPLNVTPDGKSQTIKAQYQQTSFANIFHSGSFGATGVAVPIDIEGKDVVEQFDGNLVIDGKLIHKVTDGLIPHKDKMYPINLPDGYYIIRKLTVDECKRLQCVPEDFVFPVSDSQAYKMLGNGWCCDVISHLLSFAPHILDEPLEVISMYDGMSCGMIALNKLQANVISYKAFEIDKYCIQTSQANFKNIIQCGDAFQVRDWS